GDLLAPQVPEQLLHRAPDAGVQFAGLQGLVPVPVRPVEVVLQGAAQGDGEQAVGLPQVDGVLLDGRLVRLAGGQDDRADAVGRQAADGVGRPPRPGDVAGVAGVQQHDLAAGELDQLLVDVLEADGGVAGPLEVQVVAAEHEAAPADAQAPADLAVPAQEQQQ